MKKRFIVLITALQVLWGCQQTGIGNIKPGRTTTDPSVIANINLGVEYMRRDEFEKALDRLERARSIDPGYFETYNMLGLLHQRLGQYRIAEENFKKALRLNGADSATMNNYGQFLCQRDRISEATEVFQKAADNPLYETPEIAVANAGFCALREKDLQRAEQYLRRALELNPKFSEALLPMAQLSYDMGNYLSARGYLQRYLEVSKHTARTLWLGIRIEKELGDKNAVSSYSLLLLNNFPKSEEAEQLKKSSAR